MSLDSDLREMARIPLFAALEHEARRLLAFSAETRILRSDDTLFRKGEVSDGGYLLLQGALEIERDDAGSRKMLVPPVLIGEMALLTETERPATVVARAPSTVLKVTKSLFQRVLKEHPKSAAQMRGLIDSRLASFSADLEAARKRGFSEPTN